MTSKILKKSQLSENVFRMKLEAPLIARERKAGQFIILRCDAEFGERIPLTIADADAEAGTIDIIFQSVGVSTKRLSLMNEGDTLPDLVGPLGRPTEIPGRRGTESAPHVIVVGGRFARRFGRSARKSDLHRPAVVLRPPSSCRHRRRRHRRRAGASDRAGDEGGG